jgi:magnesium chelatase family protein
VATVVNSFAISGVDGYEVMIECDTIFGKPLVSIVGLGDAAIKEARERLEAAIIHAKYEFPKMKIVINLAPGDIKKSGSHFDLGMAIGLLMQTDQIKVEDSDAFGFIGELSLNAELRPCSGILPMAIEAKKRGVNNLIVPRENIQEASLVNGINIFGFDKLVDVIAFLEQATPYTMLNQYEQEHVVEREHILDFRDVQGQDAVIEFIVLASAGGHNLLLSGPPGCGKSMIAKRIPTILPAMSEEEALEVTKIYSVCGLLKKRGKLISVRPFRAPHHNASTNSLVGGGNNAMPGEISLAHNGVLFLDEIAEFNGNALDALRQPMEDHNVTISRVKYTHTFPSSFMLVAAMNPCPCGYYGYQRCHCTDYEVLKYRRKISGPILDRIDIQKHVAAVDFMDLSKSSKGATSAELRQRVEIARNVQKKRFQGIQGVNFNAQMNSALINEYCKIDDDSKRLFQLAYEKFRYSARSYHKFLKLARTFADMEESENIRKPHVATALMCRDLDKEQSNMIVV